jgi:hypothetical protein
MAGRTGVSAGLKQIVGDYEGRGVDLSADPRLAEAILLDSFPEAPAEINALVEAIRSGAIEYMRDRAGQGAAFSIQGSATQLSESAGLREDLARWAVESWWNALSLGPEIPTHDVDTAAGTGSAAAIAVIPVPPTGVPAPPPGMPTAQPMGSSDMTATAAEPAGSTTPAGGSSGSPLPGQPYATGQQGYPTGGPQQFPPPPGAPQQYGTGQPSSAAAPPTYQAGPPSYATGAQGFTAAPAGYGSGAAPYPPGGHGGPPSQPSGGSNRGKILAAVVVVVVILAYVGVAAAAKLPPFKKAAVATTTTTTSTVPPTTATTTPTTVATSSVPTTAPTGALANKLLAAIPNSSNCVVFSASDLHADAPQAAAGYRCTPVSGGPLVNYFIFSNQTLAATEFSSNLPATLKSGTCTKANNVVGTYSQTSGSATIGKLACFLNSSKNEELLWTHFSDNIVAATENTPGATLSQLVSDWDNSGPS